MDEVLAFKCSTCNMTSLYRSSVKRHEKNCVHNPKNMACRTCKHYSESMATFYNNYHNGDPGSTDYDYLSMWCEASDSEIFDKQVHCKLHEVKDAI